MKIRTKLALNTGCLLVINATIVGAGLVGMGRVREKVEDLTERSTPYQIRTLDFQRSLQSVLASLTRASASRSMPELQAAKTETAATLAEERNAEKAVAALSASQSVTTSEELTGLAGEVFSTVEESLKAGGAAEEASRRASVQLAESSRLLKDLDSKIRALQLNRMALFMTKIEQTSKIEEVRDSPAITQSSIATNCLLGNSELVWLSTMIEARSQQLLSARNPGEAAAAAQAIREAFEKYGSSVTYLEKMLKKLDAGDELKTLASVKATTNTVRDLLLSETGAYARIGRNMEMAAKVDQVNQRLRGVVSHHAEQSRARVSGAQAEQERTVQSVNQLVRGTTMEILTLGIGATLVGLSFSLVVALGIARPIREFGAMSERFGAGDFTARMNQKRKDEFGSMARHFNEAAGKIGSLVAQLVSSSDNLAQGAEELSRTSNGVHEDAGAIAALIERNAESAAQTNERMKSTRAVVAAANDSMVELTSATKATAEAGKAAQKIVGTINEIAFKTNLLSLNAAIEAARAGAAGAGFEIVAGEVRGLAAQTAKAAQTTTDLIGEIVGKTLRGSELAETTREAFDRVALLTSEVESFIGAIAGSSQDQTSQIRKINDRASSLGQISSQNAAAAEELSSAMSSFRVA